MRRGEVARLRWSTVDLDAATLTVRFTATMVGGKVIDQDSAKTDAGERTIALDPTTVQALREHRRAQREERLAVGELWADSGRMFVDRVGEPVRPDLLLRRVRHHADAAGRPRSPSTSYATAALRAGVRSKFCPSASATRRSPSPWTPVGMSKRAKIKRLRRSLPG